MKKKLILLALLSSWWKLHAQQRDSVQDYIPPDRTEIQALYSYYTQDGQHSAVTGGDGTENLQVQAVSFKGVHRSNKTHFITWQAGIDFITSASTDRIDAVLSSASLVDHRGYGAINIGYTDHKKREWQIGTGVSVESDYLAVPVRAKLSLPKKKNKEWQFSADVSIDDLRWGRLNPDFYAPVRLIYPEELRGYVHLNKYRRLSGSFISAFLIDINKRINLSVQGSVTRQQGLLSTPFHRIYFSDRQLSIERLPDVRNKFGLSGTLRQFIGGRHIFRTTAGCYVDDWGLTAFTLEEDYQYKLKPGFYLGPFIRAYYQSGTHYFAAKGKHVHSDDYYTSDYDLSEFNALHFGLSIHHYPAGKIFKTIPLQRITFRAGYYTRSDGLNSFSGSLLLQLN